ncbi:MAG TPA: metallophosphoesterase family protein [Gaiellaceae bacterium]|nr:metallophosphoesterase family protein [Gaiellaceae bacterium]
MSTLVAVISDTHMPRGSRRLPDECVRRLDAADLVLHAGDFVTADVLEELRGLGRLEAVHGNMDDDALRRSLPGERIVEVAEVRIGLVHEGGPKQERPARLAGRFPSCHAVVYGHTHMPEILRHGRTWILNPGSPTERRRSPAPTLLMLRIDGTALAPELVLLPA